MKLCLINGDEVKKGDVLTDFRGVDWTFHSVSRFPEPGKSGKVLVASEHGTSREFYPTVLNLHFEE